MDWFLSTTSPKQVKLVQNLGLFVKNQNRPWTCKQLLATCPHSENSSISSCNPSEINTRLAWMLDGDSSQKVAFMGEAQRVVPLLMLLLVPASAPLRSALLCCCWDVDEDGGCRAEESCVQAEDTHDWTRSETADIARTIWLYHPKCVT